MSRRSSFVCRSISRLVVVGAMLLAARTASAACYVAFIHGSGVHFGDPSPNYSDCGQNEVDCKFGPADTDDKVCGHTDKHFTQGDINPPDAPLGGVQDWLGPQDAPLPPGWDIARQGDPRIPRGMEAYWSHPEDMSEEEFVTTAEFQGVPLNPDRRFYSMTWMGSGQYTRPAPTSTREPVVEPRVPPIPRGTTDNSCIYFRVGWNGYVEWYHDAAVGAAARRLASYLDMYNVQDGELTIVSHSMGGLVARHILNHASPNSMYYDPAFERISRATKRLVTIQAPHAGATSADAAMGVLAGRDFPNDSAAALIAAGLRCRDRRTVSLTTGSVWSRVDDGTMGDEGRTVPIYTIAGYGTGETSGTGSTMFMSLDYTAHIASMGLCYEAGWANDNGGFCGQLPCWRTSLGAAWVRSTRGLGPLVVVQLTTCGFNRLQFRASDQFDGLVDTRSAHGFLPQGPKFRGPDGGRPPLPIDIELLAGPKVKYLTMGANHNQGRLSIWQAKGRYEDSYNFEAVATPGVYIDLARQEP
jgi:hypothetical protein